MKKTFFCIALFLVSSFFQNLCAQHRMGIVPVEIYREINFYPKSLIKPQWVLGVFYEKALWDKPWSWNTNLSYKNGDVDIGGMNCYDCYGGTLDMSRFFISTGMSYEFFYDQQRPWRWYLESGLFYSHSLYEGWLSGGIRGDFIEVDRAIDSYGILLKSGVDVYLKKHFVLGYQLPFALAISQISDKVLNQKYSQTILDFMNYGQIRVGYQF